MALQRFREVLADVVALSTSLGWPVEPAPDDVDDQIARVADAVAPRRIPAELAELWRQVNPYSLTRPCFPQFTSVASSLDGHQTRTADDQMLEPPSLFPVAYSSWQFLLVELDDEEHRGGALFDWGFAGSPYRMTHRSLTEYLEQLADFYRREDFEVAGPGGVPTRSFGYERGSRKPCSGSTGIRSRGLRAADPRARATTVATWLGSGHESRPRRLARSGSNSRTG